MVARRKNTNKKIKKYIKKSKVRNKYTKKNLGKKTNKKTNKKRVQYGCRKKSKKFKGGSGGRYFLGNSLISDVANSFEGKANDTFNTYMGNDPTRNPSSDNNNVY